MTTLPVSEGNEDLVVALLTKSRCMPVNVLGFSAADLHIKLDAVSSRQGLLLVTGTAGNGKNSTMH